MTLSGKKHYSIYEIQVKSESKKKRKKIGKDTTTI